MHENKKIKCLAVDDEPPALEVIKRYIGSIPSLQLMGTCINAVEALGVLQQQPIDLLFLDIQMPQILGTDFIRTLKKPPKVIFTTAFRKFALEGFELDAVDYLLKPIPFDRFLKAVNKVMELSLPSAEAAVYGSLKNNALQNNFISLRADRKNMQIAFDEILYIESLKDYVRVVTKTKQIICKQSIAALENVLPREMFVRIHRSYIVSLSKIESFTSDIIEIARQELPVSRMYRYEVNKVLKIQ